MSHRIVIDCWGFARGAESLEGELPVARLTRTHDLLTDTVGHLKYRVQGKLSERGWPQLELQIDGRLSVCCQRCLEGIDYPLEVRSVLEFVGDETALAEEDLEEDSVDFLPAQDEIDVVALIEDEIILSLPSAPRHDNCALPRAGQGTEKISPFSVLKTLKGNGQ